MFSLATWRTFAMRATATLLLALLALPAAAATVDQTHATTSDPEVSVEIILGSVRVIGWDRDEVQITGTLGNGILGLAIDADDDEVEIEAEYPERNRGRLRDAEAHLEISVPRGADVEIEGMKCTIDIEGVDGELTLETINGEITVVGSAELVEAESVSGDIRISGSGTEVEADSVSGSVIVTGATGAIAIATMNGDIEVDAARADSVSLESMSGTIDFRGDLVSDADLSVEAYSSAVVLVLPSTVSATFDVQTQSGDIENGFGPPAERSNSFMPGKILEFSVGEGSADVTVESFSGSVKLVKGDG